MSDDYISDRNLWNIQYFGVIVEANYDRADMEKLWTMSVLKHSKIHQTEGANHSSVQLVFSFNK